MATGKSNLRPLSLGRPVHSGSVNDDLPVVPERVPEHPVAPDRVDPAEGERSPEPRGDLFHVALVIPLRNWESFSHYVQGNIRVIKPKGWEDVEVVISVLPDLGGEFVDMDQYDIPTLDLTLLKAVPK
jgi:hypothetical protein